MKKLDQETKNLYLDSILLPVRKLLSRKVKSYAARLGVPPVWIMQMLQTNMNPDAKDSAAALRLTCAMMLHDTRFPSDPTGGLDVYGEAMKMIDEATASLLGISPDYLTGYCGLMDTYYDFYAAVACPEIIENPKDWLMSAGIALPENDAQSGDGPSGEEPMTIGEFRAYVWNSVPEEMRAVVFNLAA